MISNFNLIWEKNNRLAPDLSFDKKAFLFEGCTDSEYHNYINSSTKGVSWTFNGSEFKIFRQRMKIFGYPTPDMEKVIIIYSMDHDVFRAPSNAVIYNPDGSVHIQLNAPEPISELSNTRARNLAKTKNTNLPHRLYFDGVSWAKVKEKVETVVKVGFDRDWWEERILNPETGDFSKCLNSGMR